MDDLLRARLRIPEGANVRLAVLRRVMGMIDVLNRVLTGQAFFALREAEAALKDLDGRVGKELVSVLMARNGGTEIVARGLDHVPARGPVVIASTHPVGTFDFLAHAQVLLPHRPDLRVVANREAERFLGVELLIPIDLDRDNNAIAARNAHEDMQAHLQAGGALLIFGSGRVPRLRDGYLEEPQWRAGPSKVSVRCDAPIVPASPNMRNSRHYYRTRMLARILSGGNDDFAREVASLRYVSELLSKLGGTYEVVYGPPMPPGTPPAEIKAKAEALVPGQYHG